MTTRDLSGAVVAVVAVAGASGGLGAPIARTLAARGARLLVAGPHPDKLTAAGIDGATVVEVDLRDASAGDRLATAANERYGRLDGLVNAAGIVAFGPLVDLDDVLVEEPFLTNVIGRLWLLRRMVPLLSASGGFVVQLSAVVAEKPLPGMAVYSATKAAITAADRALSRELRRAGIHVCDCRPPHTETGLATHPVAGTAPRLTAGLDPSAVAERIVRAIENDEAEVDSAGFSSDGA